MGFPYHRTSQHGSTTSAGGGQTCRESEGLPATARVFTLPVRAEPSAVSEVRAIIAARLREWQVPTDLVDDVLLLGSELLSNVFRHVGSPFCLLCLEDGAVLRLTVTDAGHALPHVRVGDGLAESGRGMVLVAAVANRWGAEVTPSGKDVWVEFDRVPAGATTHGEGTVRWSA